MIARRSARPGRGPAGHQMADVGGMEPVGVLIRRDRFQHPAGVYMLRQRHLHQDAVDIGTPVKIGDHRQHFVRGDGFRRRELVAEDTDFAAGLDLAANVDFGSRIVAHQDHGQAWFSLEFGDARLQTLKDFVADGDTVQDLRHSELSLANTLGPETCRTVRFSKKPVTKRRSSGVLEVWMPHAKHLPR